MTREYAKHGFMLHDFFFAKGSILFARRPAGFRHQQRDDGQKTDRARKFLSDRADLIGAIRLPSTAFAGNAGTSVGRDDFPVALLAKLQAMAWGAIKPSIPKTDR